MRKLKKIVLLFLFTATSLVILSPLISLFLAEGLRYHVYRRLVYHVIVDKETGGIRNPEEKALKLFNYTVNHEFMQGIPYSCKPLESLIYAEAYCDFQARTLNSLLAIAGIPSRYAMLLDKDGVSLHTLNEILLSGKWRVVDPALNIIHKDANGQYVSLEQISANPSMILQNNKLRALRLYSRTEYENLMANLNRVFPMAEPPRRSTPRIYQAHIFDCITDIYFKLFKHIFFNFYQDAYLRENSKQFSGGDDLRLFYLARNYHLAYRYDLAYKYYNLLLVKYPDSKYTDDALFFTGELFYEKQDFSKSESLFNLVTQKYSSQWGCASFYYLGKLYEHMGSSKESLSAYHNASIAKLSAHEIERLVGSGYNKY